MLEITRRHFLAGTSAALMAGPLPTDIRIEEIHFDYEDYRYRTPYKFGGVMVTLTTLEVAVSPSRSVATAVSE